MNTYADLKGAVASEAHRADLTAEIPRFIRECEGMIRRELRALTLGAVLTDTQRITPAEGRYTLPSGFQEMRAAFGTDGEPLELVSIVTLRRLRATAGVFWYALHDDTVVEYRGVPGVGTSLGIVYLGYPAAFVADGDSNTLLLNHESIYLRGALFYLYRHEQDLEQAQTELEIFNGAVEALNERAGRTMGGGSIAGAYNLFGGGGPR